MARISGRWLTSLAPLLLTGALAGSSYWLSWLANLQSWSDSPRGSLATPDYFIENFTLKRVTENGSKQSKLSGTRLEHLPKEDTWTIAGPRFDNSLSLGPNLTARSEQGTYSNLNGKLLMTGSVTLKQESLKGETTDIATNTLSLDTDNQVAWMPQGGVITRGNTSSITAQSLLVNNLDSTLEANGRVRVELKPATNKAGGRS